MNNRLSTWSFAYRPSYYLKRPWKWFHEAYWNIRNFIHRGRYGYAYIDVWNFCEWYPRVGAEALRCLAKKGSGYPGVEPWDTPEKWSRYLRELAEKLDRCADSMDILTYDAKNEYAEQFNMLFNSLVRHQKVNEDGSVTTWRDETPDYLELRDKYFAREKEIVNELKEYRKEVGAEVFGGLGRLWD